MKKHIIGILVAVCLMIIAVPAASVFAADSSDISSHTISLSAEKYTYDGQAKTPVVTIEGLTEGTDFTVTYDNNTEIGTAKVMIKGTGSYKGNVKKEFLINPCGTTMLAPGSVTGFKATLKWNAGASDIYGYEVSYSTSSTFSGASELRIEGPAVTSKAIEKLQPNKTYYARVRTIKYDVKGVKYYSDWSAKKSFKTKNTGWYHAMCLKSKTGYKGQGSIYRVSLSGSTLTVKAKWNTGSTEDMMLMKPVSKPYCTTKFKLTSNTKYYTTSGTAGKKRSTKSYVLKVMKSSSGLSCIMHVKAGKVLSITISS